MSKIYQGLKPIATSSNGGTPLTPEQIALINSISQKTSITYVNEGLDNKADVDHTHEIVDINGLQDALNDRYTKAETMSKTEIENLITSIILGVNWKTPVNTKTDLPSSGNNEGDARIVKDEDVIYIFSNGAWIEIGNPSIVNLATQTQDGLMSKEDKTKLDSIIVDDLVDDSKLNDELKDYAKKTDLNVYLKPSNIVAGKNIEIEVDSATNDIIIKSNATGGSSSDFDAKNIKAGNNVEITDNGDGTITISSINSSEGGNINLKSLPTFGI